MTYNFYLPTFAKNLAEYLQDNFISKLYTDIRTTKDTISVKVYMYDASFNDDLEVGEYLAHFADNGKNGTEKVKQEFRGHPFMLDEIHLVYEKNERKDQHRDIPFP